MSFTPQTFNLAVPLQTFYNLCQYRAETQGAAQIQEIIAEAVSQWLERKKTERARSRTRTRPMTGYQWKRLFLPDGTILRTHFRRQHLRARVEKSRIVYNGTAMSPNDFARAGGGSNRNAWKAIWLMFPGEREWRLADECRPAPRPRKAAT
ncbi:MAG: hypothetical protein ACXWC4_03905 [Telluria sp.]